jgi:hypothetical protein
LGYVAFDDVWLKTGTEQPAESRPNAEKAKKAGRQAIDPEDLIQDVIRKHIAQLVAIRGAHLIVRGKVAGEESLKRGMDKIFAIRDPLAIPAVARVLCDENHVLRQIMVRALGRFQQDEALMDLVAVALLDPDQAVRQDAVSQLARRNDPRVVALLREALGSESEFVLLNAAEALAGLKALEAVPDLAKVLKRKPRNAGLAKPLTREQLLANITKRFAKPTKVKIDGQQVVYHPEIGVLGPKSPLTEVETGQPTTDYRTEVQQALITITGVNHGFDEEAWLIWHLQNAK